ncbi:hypothetical protein JKJ07_20315 [Actinoplanes sp. LDG1-01]|uniref:Uncharacterized protein n=2 Tax=Paractinoplanes lichenicola TaxID=2802976 RepID=A0ABS1VPI7_9ACTN|nr:hypothetical protein [Actinoplanes lichenicola]
MIAASHPPGDDHPGLAALLEAARAPGTPEELAGEKEMLAAFAAHRKRAARSVRRRRTASLRAALVPVTSGLALLILAGTAVAARTGNLPEGAQQHAHRLFSALGVPAPGTGSPHPSSSTRPGPGPRPSLDVTALSWCEAWRGTPERSLSREDRRKLTDAAGGEEDIKDYCDRLHRSASPSSSPSPEPSESRSSSPSPSPTGTPSFTETPSEPAAPSPSGDQSLSTDRD